MRKKEKQKRFVSGLGGANERRRRYNILEALYYGDIHPYEKSFDRDSRYAAVATLICDMEKKLSGYFAASSCQEQRDCFSQFMSAQSELLRFSELDRFIEGFQLGAGFILDTFVIPSKSVLRDIV